MDTVDAALKALNAAASKSRIKDKKLLMESAGQAATHLVLLKLSLISEQVTEKLCNFLRTSFFTLYARLTVPTLGLVSVIFETVYHERILPAMGSGEEEQKGRWESVLHALLGGVLDFLDDNHTTETKDAIGDTLFSILADICFSLSAPRTSVDLRCTGYNILIDSAASHQENQQKLRDPKILGGERLGSCIWRTKDYLALEALLNLFARVLPSTNGSTSGRAQRTAFIQSVFLRTAPSESTTTGEEIADLLDRVSSSDWDETSPKIVDAMARTSISYPQPFEVNEVVVSGKIYPTDRLYADDKTFLINVVLQQEDQYESLEVSYAAISKIRFSRSSAGRIHIILSLSSPPRLGKNFLEISIGAVAGFSLCVEDERRLLQAFKSRGLAQMITTEFPMIQKVSVATEPARLEIDSAGRLVTEPTQSERIENLSQFYRTDEKSDDILSARDSEAFCPIEITSSSVGPTNAVVPRSDRREEGTKHDHSEPSVSSTKVPSGSSAPNLASTDSKLLFDAAFGTSDDDLSEFTDEETPLPRSKIFRRASTSISIPGRISFGPAFGKAVLPQARLTRGGVGKVVLDSDDEAPLALPLKLSRNAKKALIRAPTTDTAATEDRAASSPGPQAAITSDVSTPGLETEAKVLVPATTSGRRSAAGKVLRFSAVHIPAPDFNAAVSSPPTVPASVLKSALVKKPPKPQSLTFQGSSACPSTAAVAAKSALSEKPAASRAKGVLDGLVPLSSSPTPAAKQTVKGNLRKKDKLIVDAAPVQPVKRKAAVVVDSDDDVPLASRNDAAARPAKRARASPSDRPVAPKAIPAPKLKASSPKKPPDNDSPVLRPPMPPRRRYHARKGRASSPRALARDSSGPAYGPAAVLKGNFVEVDYDELPTSPPRRSAAAGAVKKSSSPTVKAKQPMKTAAKTEEVVEVEKVEKTRKKACGKKAGNLGDGNTVKVEKAVKPKKTEKAAKVNATKASPENAKYENAGVGSMAQKNNTTSKMSTTRKARTHEPESSTIADEVANALDPEGDDTIKAATRAPPRPRRAGASAKKAKEDDGIQPEVASALEPEWVTTSPALERTKVRTDERDTSHVADTLDTADIAIAARDDAPSSDIELAFLKDVDPPQPEMVFSDPSTVNNFTEDARSSSSKSAASKLKAAKARSPTTPWDAMAQRIQPPEQPAPDSQPLAGLVMALAEDDVTAAALDAGNFSTGKNTISAKNALTTLVSVGAGKRETAVQTTAITMSPTLQDEVKPVVIDLTLDTPPKPVPKVSRPEAAPVAPLNANVDSAVSVVTEDALGRQEHAQAAREHLPQPVQHSHTVRFMSPTEPPSVHARYGQERSGGRLQPYQLNAFRRDGDLTEFAEAGDETLVDIDCDSGDPGLDAVVDVLNKLHQVVVESIANKFEGVRQEVRAGRDELVRYAAADLHTLHAQSVTHFNRLVDLEAEYATIGRNVLHANEDWVNVNRQACDTVAVAVEKHDRGTLSKQLPATLVTFKF